MAMLLGYRHRITAHTMVFAGMTTVAAGFAELAAFKMSVVGDLDAQYAASLRAERATQIALIAAKTYVQRLAELHDSLPPRLRSN